VAGKPGTVIRLLLASRELEVVVTHDRWSARVVDWLRVDRSNQENE
jgi:hypothetical protein